MNSLDDVIVLGKASEETKGPWGFETDNNCSPNGQSRCC